MRINAFLRRWVMPAQLLISLMWIQLSFHRIGFYMKKLIQYTTIKYILYINFPLIPTTHYTVRRLPIWALTRVITNWQAARPMDVSLSGLHRKTKPHKENMSRCCCLQPPHHSRWPLLAWISQPGRTQESKRSLLCPILIKTLFQRKTGMMMSGSHIS